MVGHQKNKLSPLHVHTGNQYMLYILTDNYNITMCITRAAVGYKMKNGQEQQTWQHASDVQALRAHLM